MPRARRSGGNISAAAARESITIACAAPQKPSPRKTSSPELDQQPSAMIAGPRGAEGEAGADHGHPPDPVGDAPGRSDRERAGDQEHGRPEPEDPLEPGDRDERHRPERDRELHHPGQADEPCGEHDRVAAGRGVTRPLPLETPPEPPRRRATGGGGTAAERLVGDAPDRDDAAAAGELAGERQARGDLGARRAAVRALVTRVRRHDVPEQHLLLEPEFGERPWTIVAVASAGPVPVNWRSEVSGIPETRAPRQPGASATSRIDAPRRSSR